MPSCAIKRNSPLEFASFALIYKRAAKTALVFVSGSKPITDDAPLKHHKLSTLRSGLDRRTQRSTIYFPFVTKNISLTIGKMPGSEGDTQYPLLRFVSVMSMPQKRGGRRVIERVFWQDNKGVIRQGQTITGKRRGYYDFIVLGDSKCPGVESPMMIFTEGYTVTWVVVVEYRKFQNVRSVNQCRLIAQPCRNAANRAGMVIKLLDDARKERMTNVIAIIRSFFYLFHAEFAVRLVHEFLRFDIQVFFDAFPLYHIGVKIDGQQMLV